MAHWFITGGTPGGFGMAYAEAALERGDRVTLTVRRPSPLAGWAPAEDGRALVVPLDVTDRNWIQDAVARAEQQFGGIDVLVNNAGRGWIGSVEGMDEAAMRATLELNFFSAMAVTRAMLPGMRARRGGWVVMMSSAAGLRPVTGFGWSTRTADSPAILGGGVRAVLEAMERADPPRRLVLGAAAFEAAVGELESALVDVRSGEVLGRAADFVG